MVSVKMLKPYQIISDDKQIKITLAYQYFSIVIEGQVYHFVPIDAKEIIICKKTKRIMNIDARFAFQREDEVVYITMVELINLPDFLIQLFFIVESHFIEKQSKEKQETEIDLIIKQLEQQNILRLIDNALDNKDAETFYSLVKLLD